MKRRPARWLVISLVLMTAFTATTSLACGPFSLDAIFTFTVHPAYPLERYARGELGVVQPSYARSYLFVAYRQLSGLGFSEREQAALVELWKDRLDLRWSLGDEDWVKAWLTARQRVPGLSQLPKIEVYRNREKPNEYESYVNCQKDAFENATTTLNARLTKYGNDSLSVKEWTEAQDQVFANCAEGRHVPVPVSNQSDALLRADRSYQIAAANFYAGDFAEARKGFEAIATDTSSPWQRVAPYLIARTLVRKASLGAPESKTDSLSQAETQLRKILADKRLSESHASAARLLDLVRLRLHPSERMHELAHSLISKSQNPSLKQQLWDYTILLDQFLDTDDAEAKSRNIGELRTDELSDWISSFQRDTADVLEHSLTRWKETQSPAWLIASLTKVKGTHTRVADLIKSASVIRPGSPAFASARFHVARLLVEQGKVAEARASIDELLRTSRNQFDSSSLNLLTSQRMSLANSLADFLAFASRVPAGLSWDDDGRQIPAAASDLTDETKPISGKALFDQDAANSLNERLPLVVMKDAATSSTLPVYLKRDLVQATWLRAVMLGDYKVADELAPALQTLVPGLTGPLKEFLATTDPDAKRFAAVFTWLKFPGLEPVVDVGIGRTTPLNEQDVYRDNWWCAGALTETSEAEVIDETVPKPITAVKGEDTVGFLTAPQKTSAAAERERLRALGAGPNYLCKQVIQWVTKNPTDPRAPEALHLAVNTTRHGCTDKQTGRWSKAAYDLLHRKYPNTSWAKKTKYWFKD